MRPEQRLLEDRVDMLTKKAIQDMRSLGRSRDFKAVSKAINVYEDFPEDTHQVGVPA